MMPRFPISHETHKIEAAAVKAALLDLGFAYDRSGDVFVYLFATDAWISVRASDALTFDSAARQVGKHFFRRYSFGKEAFRLSQSIIAAASAFEDEQVAIFASHLKM
jgi:hypothetical protein